MRRAFWAIVVLTGYILFSLAQNPATKKDPAKGEKGTTGKDTAYVDYEADVMTNRGDDVTRLIGNVHFHHNGAIIQCDSALRYDENRMECFGNVIISQDSTYIYGDRAYYDGTTSIADIYAPMIKLMKGDMTLYTYNLAFNTKTNIGTYWGGGVITQRENLMESMRGQYNSKTNVVKFLDSVSMRSDTYLIRTDSLSYNMDLEQATFLDWSYIWDHERDFLRADMGDYYAKDSTYVFTRNAYVMTEDREMWADTMRYVTSLKQAFMLSNAQILDTVNSTVMFGNWAFYDDSLGRAVMARMPSVRSWQVPDSTKVEQKPDTTYMRADSILLFTFEPGKSKEGVQRKVSISDSTIRKDTLMVVDTSYVEELMQIDTIFDYRDTLIVTQREELDTLEKERVVRAYHDVRTWNKDFQMVGDSTVSFSVDSTAIMFGRPIIWNENNQIMSDQIDLYTKNEELDWADFTGSPFIVQQALPGDTVHFNQASGKRLKAFFVKNDIDRAILTGNVLNLYYKDEDKALETLAAISCAELTIMFSDREPSRMIWKGSGEGTIFPIDKIPPTQPLYLEGFEWKEDLRPKSALEICQRFERPSMRKIAQGYRKPEFLINMGIEAMKSALIQNGTWRDRTDVPSVTPEHFKEQGTLLF